MIVRNKRINVYEMTCTSCENSVERAIKKLNGLIFAKASYSDQFVEVTYDDKLCNETKIKSAIQKAGYSTKASKDYKFMGILIIVATIILLGLNTIGFDMEDKLSNASYTVLFIVGVLTSIHCVGMCGGIMISQSLSIEPKNKIDAIKPSISYNLGRVISYTILGGIVGTLGSVFSLSIIGKAAIQIFAGLFMIVMGFNMAGFKIFRKIHIKSPLSTCKAKAKSGSPFIVGILNGFMPCGPLQTMQLFALGTGSAFKGALSMFVFSLGTVPLMLTFGALSGLLSKGYTKKLLKFSGVLIITLGLIMGNRGLTLAGINVNPITSFASILGKDSSNSSNANVAKATIEDGVQTINMTANNNGYTPNAFYVQKGIPVKWIINGEQLNSCNNAITIPSLNKEQKIKKGENIIEFTPENEDINFSCWMGMIRGVIKVVDNLDSVDTSKSDSSLPPASAGPSCCAVPIDEDAEEQNRSSIYGDDLTMVPTELLVTKSIPGEDSQSATFKGVGYEFQPLVIITDKNSSTNLKFDLSYFDKPDSTFHILDVNTGKELYKFEGKNGINKVNFNPEELGSYAVVSSNSVLGIINVVADLKTTDVEIVREEYLK